MKQGFIKRNSSLHIHKNKMPSYKATIGIEETSAFIKKQISQIIKKQLKVYQLRAKLALEMEEYQKKEQNKKISKQIFEDKMQGFRQKQRSIQKKQYELFIKKQKERQQRLKDFINQKNGSHKNRFAHINKSMQTVKERFVMIESDEANMRLSKVVQTAESNRRLKSSYRSQNSRALSTSQSQSHRDLIKQMQEEKQIHMVTNYLNKISRSQSRVMLQLVEKDKRREAGLRRKVKCLVAQRKKKEEQDMQKTEKQYNTRMDIFSTNLSRINTNKQSMLQSRAILNDRARQKIQKKRDQMQKEEFGSLITNYNNGKQNKLLKHYRSALDINNSKRSMFINMVKMQVQNNNQKIENNMKILTQKIDKIKNIQYGQKLDQRSIQTILGMIDKSDPEFASILEFLKSERKTFIEAIIKKEEEKNKFDKLKKMNKAQSKATGN